MISSSLISDRRCIFHKGFENDIRFSLEVDEGVNHLTIKDIRPSDSATYYCAMSDLTAVEFTPGTFLHVRGSESEGQNAVRRGGHETVPPGGSVDLSCVVHGKRCNGERGVYWLKYNRSQHAVVYNNEEQCEGTESTGLNCTFHLAVSDIVPSDAGIYRCAVLSCGEILFGSGTALAIAEVNLHSFLVFGLAAALGISLVLIFVLSCIIYKSSKQSPSGCTGDASPPRRRTESYGNQGVDNLHYAAVTAKKCRPSQRDNVDHVCIYSAIRT